MPLTLTDCWSWKQLVDLSHLIPKQQSLLMKADDETVMALDDAISTLFWFLLNEMERRDLKGQPLEGP